MFMVKSDKEVAKEYLEFTKSLTRNKDLVIERAIEALEELSQQGNVIAHNALVDIYGVLRSNKE